MFSSPQVQVRMNSTCRTYDWVQSIQIFSRPSAMVYSKSFQILMVYYVSLIIEILQNSRIGSAGSFQWPPLSPRLFPHVMANLHSFLFFMSKQHSESKWRKHQTLNQFIILFYTSDLTTPLVFLVQGRKWAVQIWGSLRILRGKEIKAAKNNVSEGWHNCFAMGRSQPDLHSLLKVLL